MKEVPRTVIITIILIAVILLGVLLKDMQRGDVMKTNDQYLDQLDIQTDNPQPAGRNIVP